MGTGSDWAIEIQEEKYREIKDEWIRKKLGNPDADENTAGWADLEIEYDEMLEEESVERDVNDDLMEAAYDFKKE
jgi:hypothetical protein